MASPALLEFPKSSKNVENEYLGNETSYEFQTNAKAKMVHFTCKITKPQFHYGRKYVLQALHDDDDYYYYYL